MKTYKPKFLIGGHRIGTDYQGKTLVGIPAKHFKQGVVRVDYGEGTMFITIPEYWTNLRHKL